jgi:hypothetical protein
MKESWDCGRRGLGLSMWCEVPLGGELGLSTRCEVLLRIVETIFEQGYVRL